MSYLLPRRNRATFYDWYAYLRWIDDVIDTAPPHDGTALAMLARHRHIARGVPCAESRELPQEAVLRRLTDHDRNTAGPDLSISIAGMLDCIAYDAQRRGQVEPHERLQHHWDLEVYSYLSAIACCCEIATVELAGLPAARGAKIVHIVRDLDEDIRDHQFNLSAELGAHYGFAPNQQLPSPHNDASAHCIASLLRQADALLEQGRREMTAPLPLRYRLIVLLLISKYQSLSRSMQRQSPARALAKPGAIILQLTRNMWLSWRNAPLVRPDATANAITLPLTAQIGLIGSLLPFAELPARARLDRAFQDLDVPNQSQVHRRFRVACVMGREALHAIAPEAARDRTLRRDAGYVYGFWAIAAIELDRVMDEKLISAAAAAEVTRGWLVQQEATLAGISPPDSSSEQIAQAGAFFSRLAAAFKESLEAFLAGARRCSAAGGLFSARTDFQAATASLMAGQLRSLAQVPLGGNPDWGWYAAEVLNTKNVQFLLAPFHLWRLDAESDTRLTRLVEGYEKLNCYYLHYQVIDDVADLHEDTRQGIVGAPGAILLSQRAIAQRVLAGESRAALAKAADATELISGQIADAPQYDSFRAYLGQATESSGDPLAADLRLRSVLLNRPREHAMPLESLAEHRLREGNAYRAALDAGEPAEAAGWLLRSGAPQRLVDAAGHPAFRIQLRQALGDRPDPHLKRFLFILERLMRHTHAAARRVVEVERS